MQDTQTMQLSQLLDHSSRVAVMGEVERVFRFQYRPAAFRAIRHAYGLIDRLFVGKFPGYRSCNTEYHDQIHTLNVLLAAARLIDGHALARDPLPEEITVDLYMAALLHDTGYIQREDDREGTGAKYTLTHVERSIAFALEYAAMLKIPPAQAEVVGRLISGTNLDYFNGPAGFHSETEGVAGALLATADLLGQMSDRAYLEKLIFLYRELREAGVGDYKTEFDILKSTLGFYKIVRERFDGPLRGVYKEAAEHFERRFGIPRNLYMESIERQMDYLEKIIADDTTNFRKKLKRIDLEKVDLGRVSYPA
jgi:hypothetical protein